MSQPVGGRFINRDESWLLFNQRVLEEAGDPTNPVLERLKFLAITASNLDEFTEIRVAGVLQRLEDGLGLPQITDEGGLTPQERVDRLRDSMHTFCENQAETWTDLVQPALESAGIRILHWKQLKEVFSRPGRPSADTGHHRSIASVSSRAEQGSLPGSAAAVQA
jgi:polyphosphate kinase